MQTIKEVMHRKVVFFFILIHFSFSALCQNTSNKGTDFWVGYMAHIDGFSSEMSLYITSDVSTSGILTIPGQGFSISFSVTADSTTIINIPSSVGYVDCSECTEGKGIHITSVLPVVVYSHIYASERSDATLVLPVSMLGKEYYAVAFTQTSGGYSEFLVVATEDSTQVQITPSAATLYGHGGNTPFVVTLNRGEVYQVQSLNDLTGSHIESFSSGASSCKKIAVFSGSTWCALGCGKANSSDNLYEQLYAVNTWGSNFITAPFQSRYGDYFRFLSGSDSTWVTINGSAPYLLNKGEFMDQILFDASYVSASNPITLAQYPRTANCDNQTGDPSMVIVPDLENNMNRITLFSPDSYAISGEYINVIMKTANTGSFLLDGSPVSFLPVQTNSSYSYSQNSVLPGTHSLSADSGFSAVAYGFGLRESYAYCAGANIRNLNLTITASSGGITNPTTLCAGSSVNFSPVLGYTPQSVKWFFGDGDTSSSVISSHVYNIPGSYTISLVTIRSTGIGCDLRDSSTYDLIVTPCGILNVSINHSDAQCYGTCTGTADANPVGGISPYKYLWNNGKTTQLVTELCAGIYSVTVTDSLKLTGIYNVTISQPASLEAGTISAIKDTICEGTIAKVMVSGNSGGIQWQSSLTTSNFKDIPGATNLSYTSLIPHTTYFRVFTASGNCADTSEVFKLTAVPAPVASFTYQNSGRQIIFNSGSSVDATDYYWDFDDQTNSTLANPTHIFDTAGTYHVCLTLKNRANCNFTLCQNVTVFPDGVNVPDVVNYFDVFPNPFGDNLFIKIKNTDKSIYEILLYDVTGRIVSNFHNSSNKKMIEIPLADLPSAMYYLKIETDDAVYFTPILKY